MHDVQQLGGGVGGAAEPIGHFAVREMRVHLTRMHGTALADEIEHGHRLFAARGGPCCSRSARMHQPMMGTR
jgi:hypothetical protein